MLKYEVNNDPEIRREVSQLQRSEGIGRLELGTVKVWVAKPQEHSTVSSREALIFATATAIKQFETSRKRTSGNKD